MNRVYQNLKRNCDH